MGDGGRQEGRVNQAVKGRAFVRIGLHRPGWNRPELQADPIDRTGTKTTEALALLSVAGPTNVTVPGSGHCKRSCHYH